MDFFCNIVDSPRVLKFFLAQVGENLQLVVFWGAETACAAVAVARPVDKLTI